MTGKKGCSGRPKGLGTLVREAMDRVDQALPDLFQSLIDRANQGDREAAIYLIDRMLGKPKQQVDMTSEINLKVTASGLRDYRRQALSGPRNLLADPSDDPQEGEFVELPDSTPGDAT